MDAAREKVLRDRYPGFLADCDIEVRDGWYGLVGRMLEELADNDIPAKFTQIKSKFGQLRAYFDCGNLLETEQNMAQEIVDKYESASMGECELCGNDAAALGISGWTWTLCPKHKIAEEMRREH